MRYVFITFLFPDTTRKPRPGEEDGKRKCWINRIVIQEGEGRKIGIKTKTFSAFSFRLPFYWCRYYHKTNQKWRVFRKCGLLREHIRNKVKVIDYCPRTRFFSI